MCVLYLLSLIRPEGVPQQLHRCRGVHEPAGGAHHEGEQAAQLLHERYVPLVLFGTNSEVNIAAFAPSLNLEVKAAF